MSEINVTPFVDVMLVLLVVFMVAAPLLTVGVPVDLPNSKAQPLPENTKPLSITVDMEGKLYIQDEAIDLDELVPRLKVIFTNRTDDRIYLHGDQNVDYGVIMKVMGRMNGAGFSKVALVTDAEN
ncbi:protein TolR [Paremcibacter congregatus]|uniref:Protein TolR n=2 Tax=Paremcibacter congregatus TaxID=2043170 RepID=A0A2G4YTU3_9PROT|nr:protein TolR [Paremcibacter congregatus]QDE29174.1 protein TolR [Paremcibacter congregatus]